MLPQILNLLSNTISVSWACNSFICLAMTLRFYVVIKKLLVMWKSISRSLIVIVDCYKYKKVRSLVYIRILFISSKKSWYDQPHRAPPSCSASASVALAAQAQLAATPAPPCPEFSTATNPSTLFSAQMLKPSFLIGRSVFQLSKPSPELRDIFWPISILASGPASIDISWCFQLMHTKLAS